MIGLTGIFWQWRGGGIVEWAGGDDEILGCEVGGAEEKVKRRRGEKTVELLYSFDFLVYSTNHCCPCLSRWTYRRP